MSSSNHTQPRLTQSSLTERLQWSLEHSTHSCNTYQSVPPSTQPVPEHMIHRRLKQSRTHTTGQISSVLQPLNELEVANDARGNVKMAPEVLKTTVMREIRTRLRDHGIETHDLSELFFSWALPKRSGSVQDWVDLLRHPILLSSKRLTSMIDLRISRPHDNPPKVGQSLFYIRTFTMTMVQLRYISKALLNSSAEDKETPRAWLDMMADRDSNTDTFIRYIGTTIGESGWQRHHNDLVHLATKRGLLGNFLRIMTKNFPNVIRTAEVHEVSGAAVPFMLQMQYQRLADVREQALISLFGLPTLLNTSSGGYRNRFQQIEEDDAQFDSLRTKTLHLFHRTTSPFGRHSLIRKYTLDVQNYANSHADTTGSLKYPLNETIRALLELQSTPVLVANKYAVMVLIGSDLTADVWKKPEPFLNGGSSSGVFINQILDNLAKRESSIRLSARNLASEMQSHNRLPFVDLFPWAKKNSTDLKPALQLLRSYLQATKPLVTVSFGYLVASYAAGNFQNSGIRETNFTASIGRPLLSVYEDDYDNASDDNYCVAIACFHPGSIAYRVDADKVLMRLINKALAVAWLAMSEAMELTQQGLSKYKICELVIESVQRKTGCHTKFGHSFAKLKEAYLNAAATSTKGSGSKSLMTTYTHDVFESNGQRVWLRPVSYHVTIDSRAELKLKWKEAEEVVELDNFLVPGGCLPSTSSDGRFLHLIRSGLNICDEGGHPLGLAGNRAVTMPLSHIIAMLNGNVRKPQFLALWERMTGYSWKFEVYGSASDHDLSSYPATFFEKYPRSLPYETTMGGGSNAKRIETLKGKLPFYPSDAGWIVNEFLIAHYPNGGTLDLGNPQEWPGCQSIWPELKRYLSNALWTNHPQRDGLVAVCDLATDNGKGGQGKCVIAYWHVLMNVLRTSAITKRVTVSRTSQNPGRSKTTIIINAVIPDEAIAKVNKNVNGADDEEMLLT